MRVVAILTAAGEGTRLGHALPKALVELDGEPLVAWAARALLAADLVEHLVVTAPTGQVDSITSALSQVAGDVPVEVVLGGPTRQLSVTAGLARLSRLGLEPDAVVLVHDAARPLVPVEVVTRVVSAVKAGHGAVIPAIAVTDTIKQVEPAAGGSVVAGTVDRRALRAVQTPQGFAYATVVAAHAAATDIGDDEATAATDDAGLVEALGRQVWVVEGHEDAMKVTTARDLAVAHGLIGSRQ